MAVVLGGYYSRHSLALVDVASGNASEAVVVDIPALPREFLRGGAVALSSQSVLMCGGYTHFASCYHLDPVTRTLTAAPGMPLGGRYA